MSLLLQALLGANVDGSGLSFHVDGLTSRDTCDNLPMAVGTEEVAKEGQKRGLVVGTLGASSCFIFGVRRVSWIEAVRDTEARPLQVRV